MLHRHLLGLGVAAGCWAGLVVLGVVYADDDESPREQHRSVVLGLAGGATAAIDAATDQDVVRTVTRISGPWMSSPGQGADGRTSRALTPGGGSQTRSARPSSSLCPRQSCETLPDGSVRIIRSGPAPGATWFTDLPRLSTTDWAPLGAQGVDTGAVAGELVQEVRLPDIVVRTNPILGVVAIPTWYWVEGYAGDTLGDTRSVSTSHDECRNVEVLDPDTGSPSVSRECRTVTDTTTVAIRIQPTTYQWSFGDGGRAEFGSADGLGTPFRGLSVPSTVQHTYEYSSVGLSDGFPLRLTVTFAAAFQVNGGPWQALGDVSRTYASALVVRQIEPLRLSLGSIPAP
jgi:hypothetical protein